MLDDVRTNQHFLVSEAETINLPERLLPFDYASVEILWQNLFFVITRGRREVTEAVAPRHAKNQPTELGSAIAAVEGRPLSEKDVVRELGGAGDLLRPRLSILNAAFSEQEFSRTWMRS